MDQQEDQFITRHEFGSLYENLHRVKAMKTKKANFVPNTEKIDNMDRKTRKTFQKMCEWISSMNISIPEVFAIFDEDRSGEISKAEFYNVIEQVHPHASIEEK